MNTTTPESARIDEVERHYAAPRALGAALQWLFYPTAILAFATLYAKSIPWDPAEQILSILFVLLTVSGFVLGAGQRLYWLPYAERQRARQLISDGLGTKLTHDRTHLYYNNGLEPSLQRVGVNVMENAFFAKAVAAESLKRLRWRTGVYFAAWLVTFTVRHNDLALLAASTQFVFSADVAMSWLNLEILQYRFERCFEELQRIFRVQVKPRDPDSEASILAAVISYECAKASAATLLDDKAFHEHNARLTDEWNRIREDLKLG